MYGHNAEPYTAVYNLFKGQIGLLYYLHCNGQSFQTHSGSIAWNNDIITSGSRDNSILQWDHRSPQGPTRKLTAHTQEVCGLKWSPDHQLLASGGNDNKLLVWNLTSPTPVKCHTEHTAAIKAIAWSPHQVYAVSLSPSLPLPLFLSLSFLALAKP